MPKSKLWTSISFSISINDRESVLRDIEKIAKRERQSRSTIIVAAMKEYRDRHIQGQSQTLLNSYSDGGELNQAAIEGRIREHFRTQDRDIRYGDIIQRCKQDVPDVKVFLAMADRVAQWLHEKGIKVWR